MKQIPDLAAHIAPDNIRQLERSAQQRLDEAACLSANGWALAALYLLGYSVEMCLAAAYFRSAGFDPALPIDRETRKRRMAHARTIQTETGQPLMSGDPHPIVGCARYLRWHRQLSGKLSTQDQKTLTEAVRRAEIVYRHWRPELRYKTTQVQAAQLAEVRLAAEWFNQNVGRI